MNEGKQKEAWELFKKRILEEAAKPGSNQSRVAERLGVHRTAISRWLSGRLKGERISVDDMRNYFDRLGLDPTPYFGDAAREAPQGVPLIGLAACGYDYWQKAIELPVTTTAAPPGALPPDMFAVIATGDSLVPEGIREGMIAFCDPGAKPKRDDIVYVERDNGTMSLKIFREQDAATTVLEGWTPKDGNGEQCLYTLRLASSSLIKIAPVLFIQRRR